MNRRIWWVVTVALAGGIAALLAGVYGGEAGRIAMAAAAGGIAGPFILLFALGQALPFSNTAPGRESRIEQFLSGVFVIGVLLLAVAAMVIGIAAAVQLAASQETLPWWLWVCGGLGGTCLGGLLGLVGGWAVRKYFRPATCEGHSPRGQLDARCKAAEPGAAADGSGDAGS